RHRSNSRPGSRPTTPLRRPNSRSSIRQISEEAFPLNALETQFAELADTMVTLESNFQDLQTMHESISRFNENFAAFLFGLNMNAFCIDFPEGPTAESFKRVAEKEAQFSSSGYPKPKNDYGDTETTFMTTDTSFVAEPPTVESTTPAPPSKTPARRVPAVRGGRGRGRVGSGIARGRGS
ncbi:DASH complex subunit Dam1-domain-containing protein, partial [Trichophaea hybrida]